MCYLNRSETRRNHNRPSLTSQEPRPLSWRAGTGPNPSRVARLTTGPLCGGRVCTRIFFSAKLFAWKKSWRNVS